VSIRVVFFCKGVGDTYQFINIPTPVLSPLLSLNHTLMHPEMPVHMRGLLLLAFLVSLEAASALRARDAEALVEATDQVGAGTVGVSA
jgi:hypothetical protein